MSNDGEKRSTKVFGYLDRFEELFQTAPVAIYEVDFDVPRFKNVNEAMCRMSGFTREELLSMNPFAMLTPKSVEKFKERIKAALAGEKISDSIEYQGVMKGGGIIDFVLNMKPIYDNGRIVGALVAGYDVTERKKAEEALRESE
jgi:two-component system, sporulation sensor kinase E